MIVAMDGIDEAPGASRLARFEGMAMASPLRLAVHGLSGEESVRAWDDVLEEFEACEQAMSRFRESSEITALNRASVAGGAMRADRRLRRALVAADRAGRVTGGRFDARRLRDLDRLGYRGVPIGTQRHEGAEASRTGPMHGGRLLELGPDGCVRLRAPVDLGGIGKGLALRWAAERVRARLGEGAGALLEAGGDIVAIGPAPDGEAWLVGVDDPWARGSPLAVVALLEAAVATSSIAVNRWRGPDGEIVHHLLDPATGAPGGHGLVEVTVHGQDPAWAEVRTKQLFLAGLDGIGLLARSLGLAAWWVAEDGSLAMTPGARLLTAWSAPPGGG
jgi:thiamine biosynthesis lipoprotein